MMLVATVTVALMSPARIPIPESQVVCTIPVLTREELGHTEVNYIAELRTLPQAPTPRGPREFRQIVPRGNRPESPFIMDPKWGNLDLQNPQAIQTVDVLKGLGASEQSISEVVDGFRQALRQYKKTWEGVRIDPNLGVLPDGWNIHRYGYQMTPQYCQFQLSKQWKEAGEVKTEDVSTSRVQIATAWLPLAEPYYKQFIPDSNPGSQPMRSIAELVGGGVFQSPEGEISTVLLPRLPDKPATSILGYAGSIGSSLTGKLSDTLRENPNRIRNFLPQGRDMNHLYFPWSSSYPGDWRYEPDSCGYNLFFPPGTMWYPSSPLYQTMMSGVRYRHTVPILTLTDAVQAAQEDSGQMRVLCMNMEKKEPGPGVTYFPYQPIDPVVPQLAKLMDESNFRGPWDQARLWIYTDHASLDEINKRVVAKLPAAAYVLGLADVDWLGGLTPEMRRSDKFVKPEYIAGSAAPAEAHEFLMTSLNDDHPGAVGQWIGGNAEALLKLADGDQYDQDYLAKLINELLMFDDPRDRLGAIKFVQQNQAPLSALRGKLGSGIMNLYSKVPEERAGAANLKELGFFK